MILKTFSATAALLAWTASCAFANDEAMLERGRYLMQGPVACGNCHSPITPEGVPIAGKELSGRFLEEAPEFKLYPPNITPHEEDGIGAWSDEAIIRAIREGMRPDGSLIGPPMPFAMYRKMSDDDAAAIVAYIRALPPVAGRQPKTEYRIPLPASYGPPVGNVSAPSPDETLAYGEYLVTLAHCLECHSPPGENGAPDLETRLAAGGMEFHGPWGVSVSANITSDADIGIGSRTDAELKRIITTGVRPDGTKMLPPMPYGYYANISDSDLDAMIAYIRTLPPKP